MRSYRPHSPHPRRVRPSAATHPPPPDPPGEIGVLATMSLGDHAQWLRVGVAHVEAGIGGALILCVRLGAIPMDHQVYIPLGDVLTCCGVERAKRREPGHA